MSQHGSCHCKQVEFEVELSDEQKVHLLCHCGACKKLSGGEATLNQIVPKDKLKITKGELKTYTYTGDSGKNVVCYFCPTCTSHVYHHQEVMGDNIIVHTVLLDNSKDFGVGAEVYGKDRLAWAKEVAHTFEVMPPHA